MEMIKVEYYLRKPSGSVDFPSLAIRSHVEPALLALNPDFRGKIAFDCLCVNRLVPEYGRRTEYHGYDSPGNLQLLEWMKDKDDRFDAYTVKATVGLNLVMRSYSANRKRWTRENLRKQYKGEDWRYLRNLVPTKSNLKLAIEGVKKVAEALEKKLIEAYENLEIDQKGEFKCEKDLPKEMAAHIFLSRFGKGA